VESGFNRLITISVLVAAVLAFLSIPGYGWGKNEQGATQWMKTEIYFGRSIPAGGHISDSDFPDFLGKLMTKEFPKGLTVLNAYGKMEKASGAVVKQPTVVIVIVHEKNQSNSMKVQRTIDAYRSRFRNLQVMSLSSPTEPRFYPD
jgi:hypothetical protein